ncbi:IQ motif and ubiquitin-like domain-containing protein isoform X1 [Tamandua tetradactyla]|uniref:IQ motif and ubiquitin-like domain-containing protein isoform X1 n=1 Tax=Tamandua tetradactyla TaxID=48850 RepID=UPI004053AE69
MSDQEVKSDARSIVDGSEESDDALESASTPVPSEELQGSGPTEERRDSKLKPSAGALEAHVEEQSELSDQSFISVDDEQQFMEQAVTPRQVSYTTASYKNPYLTISDNKIKLPTHHPNDDMMTYLDKIKALKESLKMSMKDSLATVKVVLLPVSQEIIMPFKVDTVFKSLKDHFSHLLNIPSDVLQIRCAGIILKNNETLLQHGVKPQETVQVEIFSLNPEQYPIKKIDVLHSVSQIITVRVQTGIDRYQDISVEIVKSDFHKPFLGGFRHKITGIEYHNAGTQTVPKKLTEKQDMFCRDTQTVYQRKKLQQTANTTSTQMTKIGVYVSNMTDKLVIPGRYFSAAEYHAKRLEAVLVIQTYYRRWHAKVVVENLRRQQRLRLEWEAQEKLRKIREKEEWMKLDYYRRHNPKTKEDFELLYNALEYQTVQYLKNVFLAEDRVDSYNKRDWQVLNLIKPKAMVSCCIPYNQLTDEEKTQVWFTDGSSGYAVWRQEELTRINQSFTGAERKAALCELLEKETQIIASIGRHRYIADVENQDASIQAFLDKCSAPKTWNTFDGKITEMDTQFTIRARELQNIYKCIMLKNLSQDERLDVLLTLKHTVKEHECKLTQEILELIDREVDLMMRGVKHHNLEGLRKRIATLFFHYIKTPLFNPEVARHLKVPQDPLKFYKKIYFCHGCQLYLPSTEFSVSSTSHRIYRCRHCVSLDNEARQRESFLKYKCLLQRLYLSETDYEDDSKIAFLMQSQDVQYLTENIWASQSALSAWDDLNDLVMVRWNKSLEWSPWNCILLTKDEGVAHLKLMNIEEDYEPMFIHKIKHKHILAKNYFSQIPVFTSFLLDDPETDDIKKKYHTDTSPKIVESKSPCS